MKAQLLVLQSLTHSLGDLKDVGYLQVKLIKAMDLQSTDLSGTYALNPSWCYIELLLNSKSCQNIYCHKVKATPSVSLSLVIANCKPTQYSKH